MRRASVVLRGGRPSARSLEDLHEGAACAEEEDRPELGVLAAADDQLIAVELLHGLHGDALEVPCADALAYGLFDGLVGLAHGFVAVEIELHALHVRLVRDGLGVELEDDGVADLLSGGDGLFGAIRQQRGHGRDAIGGEDLLRLVLGEDRAALGAHGLDQFGGALLIGRFGVAGNGQ